MKSKRLFILLAILFLGSISLSAETNEEAEIYFNMGNDYFDDGRFDKAIEFYKKVIAIDTEYVDAYCNMGLAYWNVENYDKAIEFYKKVIEIYPTAVDAYYNMGVAYVYKENYDKAIECCQKAIEIDPDYAEAYYNLGIVFYEKGWKISASDNLYKAGLLLLEQNNRTWVLQTIDAMNNFDPDSPLIQKLMDKLYEE